MSGTILYPLNVLKETQPEIYTEHVKKYVGRESILSAIIPPLHCLWNDVLHLTAVSPVETKANLVKAGFEYKEEYFYKIPVEMIVVEHAVAFTNTKGEMRKVAELDYEPFDVKRMSEYQKVPEATLKYYMQKKNEGLHPVIYQFVPHVLYKGNIDTRGLDVISV